MAIKLTRMTGFYVYTKIWWNLVYTGKDFSLHYKFWNLLSSQKMDEIVYSITSLVWLLYSRWNPYIQLIMYFADKLAFQGAAIQTPLLLISFLSKFTLTHNKIFIEAQTFLNPQQNFHGHREFAWMNGI